MIKERLVLIGTPGAGKSLVGKAAAARMEVPCLDTESHMKGRGVDVAQLFREDPVELVAQEVLALEELLNAEPGVIATTGEIVRTELGRNALSTAQSYSPVVLLQVPFEVARARLQNHGDTNRPTLVNEEGALRVFRLRQPWFEETSTHEVNAARHPIDVAEDLVRIAQQAALLRVEE